MKFKSLMILFTYFLTTLFMAVNFSYGKDISESAPYNVKSTKAIQAEEAIIMANIPIELVKREGKKALLAPGTQILELSKFDFDPINRLVILEGIAELPADIVYDMNEIAGGGSFAPKHKFNISFKLPTAKKLALTRYFSIEIVEFKLDGHDYMNAVHRVNQYVVGLLTNTSFMNYMLDVKPEVAQSEDNLSLKIKQMIEKKAIRFSGNSISFKVDFKQIPQLKDYAEIEDIRLWNVSPVLLKGTDMIVLKIEAGLGKPGKEWLDLIASRYDNDTQTLLEARKELYSHYGNIKNFVEEAKVYAQKQKSFMNFESLEIRDENEIQNMLRHVESRTRKALSMENPLFSSDPEGTYQTLKEESFEYITSVLSYIKRKNLLDTSISKGGVNGTGLPFVEKRLSQETMSQAARFLRDFEFNNEQMFPELEIIFDPTIPGVILRGIMNMDINYMMELGLEGSGIEWSKVPWRAAEDTWGAGLPFEASLKVVVLDGGWLGLDITNFSILSGSEKTFLSAKSGHGDILVNWTKMALVNTVATTLIEDPTAMASSTDEEEKDTPYQKIIRQISEQVIAYQELSRNNMDLDSLISFAKTDIEKNPFVLSGAQKVAGKMELFFKELIKYDEKSGLIMFKLDPRIVSDTIMATDNKVQVWNIESLYDKKMNQTYLDLSLGYGTRSKDYIKKIKSRDEYTDSQNFVGVDESKKTMEKDLGVKIDLKSLEKLINTILADAYNAQEKEVNQKLKNDEEQSHYLMKDMSISAVKDGVLELSMTMSLIEKSKRGILNPKRWFGETYPVNRKSVMVKAKAKISVKKISDYAGGIKFAKNEVILGDEVLVFDLLDAGVKFEGQTGVLDKIVNLVASNVDFKKGGIAKKAKKVALHFLNKFLNPHDEKKNGNAELGGVKLNLYAKMFTHSEEILLQLNPHLMAVAFEVRLLPNQTHEGEKLGFVLDKAANVLSLDFSTSGNMANVDKGELLKLMVKTKETIEPLLSLKGSELSNTMNKNLIVDKLIRNSDYTKMSLYNKMNKILNQYSGVVDIVLPDTSVIDVINRNLNTEFGVTLNGFNSRRLTTSGVEIMYILSSAIYFKKQIEHLIQKIEKEQLSEKIMYFELLVEISEQIEDRMIRPLTEVYLDKFHNLNGKIVRKGLTDWNHSFYPDAIFSESVLKAAQKVLND